jgi:hypothetical protein
MLFPLLRKILFWQFTTLCPLWQAKKRRYRRKPPQFFHFCQQNRPYYSVYEYEKKW